MPPHCLRNCGGPVSPLPADIVAAWEKGAPRPVGRIAKGIPFTKQERERAAAEIARIRDENAKIFGVQKVVVDAVRESRKL